MKRQLLIKLICLIILGFPKTVSSQAESISEIRNYVSTNVLSPIFRQYAIRYERLINRNGFLRFGLSYQYPKNTDSYENISAFPFKISNKNTVITDVKVTSGYGRFLKANMGLYLAFDLFYSYSFYKDVYYYDCSGMTSESWVYLESEYNNDFGIEPQIGYKLWLLKKSRVKFIFDFYTGIGFLINLQEHITFGQGYGCYINRFEYFTRPRETKKTRLAPDVVLGVNFEIAF